jgi:hypothetical protein
MLLRIHKYVCEVGRHLQCNDIRPLFYSMVQIIFKR